MNKKTILITVGIVLLVIIIFDLYWFVLRNKFNKENTFFCPVPTQYCQTGKPIIVGNNYFGLGYNIPANTPVYAITSGNLYHATMFFAPQVAEGTYPVYAINSKDGIIYSYLTTDDKNYLNKDITRGSEIYKTSGQTFPKLGFNLVIFSNKIGPDNKTQTIQLDPAKFSNE